MTKVLMTLESDFPNDERVEKEALSLINKGFEVHLLCYTKKKEQSFEDYKGIKIHRFQISKFIYKSSALSLQFPFYFKKWKKVLKGLLKSESFDIVHIHDLPLCSVVEPLKNEFTFKTVLDLHENWPVLMNIAKFTSKFPVNLFFSFEKWKQYEKKWIHKANHIIVVIEEAKERITNLGIPPTKISVVQNTIDLNFFHLPEDIKPYDQMSLLYSGGVNEHRGLQTVLTALAFLKKENIKIDLQIVGGGNYMVDLKNLAQDLNIENQFIDKGWKNFQEMMEEISKSQILIIPHMKSEHTDATIPNKLFQYMYASKPLLVSNCKPLKRIVEQENAGIVYTFSNASELAEKLKMVYLNYKYYLKEAEKNRAIVLEKYNWKVEEAKLSHLYKNLI